MSLKPQRERKESTPKPSLSTHAGAVVRGVQNNATGPLPFTSNYNLKPKKVPRRSSKPIINWFQRKLAGTVKGKRSDVLPLVAHVGRAASRNSSRVTGRVVTSPVSSGPNQYGKSAARRKTISLNADDDFQSQFYHEGDSLEGISMTRDSLWSPASVLEADDDASVRPLPPSAPPSPALSRSSSSVLSDPRTFRSMAASTKPTTLLSIDLPGNGMAHIAQVPVTPSTQTHPRFHHIRQSSSGTPYGGGSTSLSFSAFPFQFTQPYSQTSYQTRATGALSPVQAPLHTTHHPRNNPRPSSPPLDNASLLTLASSAYAMPVRLGPQGYSSAPPSALSIGDSLSHFGGSMFPDTESTSLFVPGDDDRDVDASVRALRPRSSRRGSWGSEDSGWSAQIPQAPGTPSKERSIWTASGQTEEVSTANGRLTPEGERQTDKGIQPPVFVRRASFHQTNNIEASNSPSRDDAQAAQQSSFRLCHRSTSMDTVGNKTSDKEEDLTAALSEVKIDEDTANIS